MPQPDQGEQGSAGTQLPVVDLRATTTGRGNETYTHRAPTHVTRWGRPADGQPAGAETRVPPVHPGGEDQPERAAGDEGQKPISGESYYHNTQRKFRRNEGHGPVRMAFKARQWENWENWKAAKQEEMRQNRQRWTDDEARREEEWKKGLHNVFGGGGGSHEPKATGWIQDVTGGGSKWPLTRAAHPTSHCKR